MAKLRFCLAGEYPADTTRIGGGVLHVMYMLTETFAERDDIDFHVVGSTRGFEGVKVVEQPGVTLHLVGQSENSVVPNLLTQPAKIAPVMRDLKPNVVNSHHYVTSKAALIAGCPVVHTIHGVIHREVGYAAGRDKLATWLQDRLTRRILGKVDLAVAVAQYGLDEYARWMGKPGKVIDVPIEDLFWDIPPLAPSKGVLFAGGIGRRKNLRAAVQAMVAVARKHPDAVLYVCGGVTEQPYLAELKSLIAEEKIGQNVEFLGVVDRHRLAELLGQSIALVLPSYQETMPGVICQAMAAGRVPVVAPAGGTAELVTDGVTGFLVEADDSAKLADRLIALMDDFELTKRMGAAAREVALQRCDRRKVAGRILEICSSLGGK